MPPQLERGPGFAYIACQESWPAAPEAASNRETNPRMTSNTPASEPKPKANELAPTAPAAHHLGAGYRLRNYFLTGLIVAGPLAITVYLT